MVEGPLLDDRGDQKDRVRGVIAGSKELPARVVLDSSGLAATVRKGLPDGSPVQREIDEACLVTAWREQRAFQPEEVPDMLASLEITPGLGTSRVGWRGVIP